MGYQQTNFSNPFDQRNERNLEMTKPSPFSVGLCMLLGAALTAKQAVDYKNLHSAHQSSEPDSSLANEGSSAASISPELNNGEWRGLMLKVASSKEQ